MAAITKTMILLAVHGDVVEADVQRILDEKSARDPRVNPLGIRPNDPALNSLGAPHDKASWPKAQCRGLLVAECEDRNVDQTRLEIEVFDFAEVLGLKQGDAVTVTVAKPA